MDIVAAFGGSPALDRSVCFARFAVRSQKISQREMTTDIVGSSAKRMNLMGSLRGSLDEVTTLRDSVLSARLIANPEEGGSQCVEPLHARNLDKDVDDGLRSKPDYGCAANVMDPGVSAKNALQRLPLLFEHCFPQRVVWCDFHDSPVQGNPPYGCTRAMKCTSE
nr:MULTISPECIES: hypothetical protein [unclassified Rhizobacter]